MSRYNQTKVLTNSSDYYAPLRKSRDLKAVNQFETPILKNPGPTERSRLQKTTHVWKYGDRFYKLAYQYYGNEKFWWVIAWYNSIPTEATLPIGTQLYIPLNLEEALKVLQG